MRTFKQLGLLIAMISAFLPASAYDFEVDGLCYNVLSTTDLTCEVVNGNTEYTDTVVIPDFVSYNGKVLNIVSINCNFKYIPAITIGNNVEIISEYTFRYGLVENISIPANVKYIGRCAFAGSHLKSVEILGSPKFESETFTACVDLESVFFADSVITSPGMFYGCRKLTELTSPKMCKKISSSAFYNCESLSNIDLQDVEEIYREAFRGCNRLDTLDLSSIVYLDTDAFFGCNPSYVFVGSNIEEITNRVWESSRITSLHFADTSTPLVLTPSTRTDIEAPEKYSFFYASHIHNLYLGRDVVNWSRKFGNLVYFSRSPFYIQDELTTVKIGPLVTKLPVASGSVETFGSFYEIGHFGYFQGCSMLQSVEFDKHSQITEIDTLTFKSCSALTSIDLPEGVRIIKSQAFKDCTNLNKIVLGRKLVGIENDVFVGCVALDTIVLCSPIPPKYNSGFDKTIYMNTAVRVPVGCKQYYEQVEPWMYFWDIEEDQNINTYEPPTPCDLTIEIGSTEKLNTDFLWDTTITWISDDTSVATVNEEGVVTAISAGTAQITAYNPVGETAIWDIAVVLPPAIEVTMEESEITLFADFEHEGTVTWASSDESIATVSQNGVVTAVSEGVVIISASNDDGEILRWKITVTPKATSVESVQINQDLTIRVENGNIIAPQGAKIFDQVGREVDRKNVSPGLYIVTVGGKSFKVAVK